MSVAAARERVAAARFGVLATVRPDGRPHVVPITFALHSDRLFTAVDAKPKTTTALQRLANLRQQPACSVLVDHVDPDDWSTLWWVRVDGTATVVEEPAPDHEGIELLVRRHPQYRDQAPKGPLIVVTIAQWRGWAASPPSHAAP